MEPDTRAYFKFNVICTSPEHGEHEAELYCCAYYEEVGMDYSYRFVNKRLTDIFPGENSNAINKASVILGSMNFNGINRISPKELIRYIGAGALLANNEEELRGIFMRIFKNYFMKNRDHGASYLVTVQKTEDLALNKSTMLDYQIYYNVATFRVNDPEVLDVEVDLL
jgi:hypothetical protein